MEGVCAWGWSPHLQILITCCLTVLCLTPGALGQDISLEVVSADESPSPFPNPSDIVVGGASDVIVTVRCVSTPVSTVEWRYTGNSSSVPMGLQPFGVSQDDGVLRIYPASLLQQVSQYTCVAGSGGTFTLPVQFRLVDNLFFTNSVPPTINVGTDVTTVCPVPDIPRSTVTAENPLDTDDITYCNVMSERGVFRSRSVTVIDPTQQVSTYRIEPVNITVRPIDSNTRAAFSCSVTPDQNPDAAIQWYFEPMEFGSGMGPMMMDSRFLSSGEVGITIVGGLVDPGTSILVLDGVDNGNEGYYSCVASFSDGTTVNSSSAALIYDASATAGNADTIILEPPNILTVTEGEAVTIPCVASGSQQPTFMFGSSVPSGTQNQYSLDFTSITSAADGDYTCQVGATTSTFTIDVLEPLEDFLSLETEYVQTVGDMRITLRCSARGNPPPGQPIWRRNGVTVGAGGRVSFFTGQTRLRISVVQEEDAGIYQCLVAVDNQPATTIVQSGYFNVYFLRNIAIDSSAREIILELPNTPPTITLNCSVIAHPIPQLEWTRNGQPVVGQQAATGYMETPFSLLTVSTSELTNGVEMFNCTANLERNDPISSSISITAYSSVIITEDPQSTEPLLLGETANFTCRSRSIPFPNITWFRLQNNMEMDNGDDITIVSQREEDFTTSSVLSVRVTGQEDFTGFFCVGDNGFDNDRSDTAQLVQAVSPSFLEEPSNVTAAAGDSVSLNCTATGVSLPSLTWQDGMGGDIIDNAVYNITTMGVGDGSIISVLEFIASSEAQFLCVAENRADRTESVLVVVIIGGVPGAPERPTVTNITSRGALVSWVPVISILPVTQYEVTWLRVDNEVLNSTTVDADVTQLLLTDLRPNRSCRVTVMAINRVGAGPISDSVTFTTLEDAPEAAPNNIRTSSTVRNQIDVSWNPPPPESQNGVIVRYLVRYVDDGATSEQTTQSAITTFTSLTMAISSNTTYLVSIAAVTGGGDGPFSENVSQRTLSIPPEFPGEPPSQSPDAPVTTTTIPITLPVISSREEYSHFWVIALIVSNEIDTTQDPIEMFPNNSTFTNYSSVEPGMPYIVAEIDGANYQTTFVLGDDDNSSTSVNDFPEFYRNGPLTPGTSYTAFVWGFAPSVPPGRQVSKRQSTIIPRQYSSFTSTRFVTPIFTVALTIGAAGLGSGAVAGIVIGILFFVILLVGTAVLIFVVWGRMHLEEKLGPPPSRQGSMRLREQSQVVLTSLRNQKAESELQDLNPNDVRLPVSMEDFESYVKSMHANTDHLFSEEYEILTIKSPNLPHMHCSMPFNVNKNRYANINCFDDSRVRLSLVPGVEGSDYINANYIDGFQKKNAYIATQGPLPNTTPDFWRMVWENNSCCIIMLTNIVEKSRAKCHQYWPEAGSVSFGDLTVTIIEVQELAYYTIRTFRMNRGNDRREVKQFHYTAWPDFGVPDHPNPVIAFIRRIGNFKRTLDGPDIIHCSAGVGRTGTLVTIQSMMQMMNEEGKIDIFNFVLDMRRRRNYMVQTERQYIFIHDALLELIDVGETEIPIHILRRRVKELQAQNPDSELSTMEEEYIHLKELDSIDSSQFHSAKMSVNVLKNRFPDILPYDSYRVRLLLHPGVSGSDYMNASYVDGYQQRHQYILTQGPLKHTVDDFWRMIWEHRVSTIMMLCQLEEKGKEQSARYWPMDKLRQHGDLFVELTQVQDFPTYTMRELSITNTKINESRMVRQYQYIDWPEDHCPINAAAIIDLIGVLQKTQHQLGGGPIVVHDSTSVGRAGTFCVLSSVLEQLKVEGIVDLFFCVHSLRLQQPGLVNTMEQYKFCYQAVLEFLDSFDHYANFD